MKWPVLLLAWASLLWAVPPKSLATSKHSRWEVAFQGEKAFSEALLEAQLEIPDEFDLLKPERRDFFMKLSKGNLEGFYLSNGYFSSKVELEMNPRIHQDTLVQRYVFRIYEGERYAFRNALLRFAPDARILVAEDALRTPHGRPYDPAYISEDLQTIRTQYRQNGYLHVKVDHLEIIDTVAHRVDVEISVDPGAQVKMGRFRSIARRSGKFWSTDSLPNIGLTDTAWLSDTWELGEGQVIDGTYYSTYRTKLFSTQLFSQVKLEDTLRSDGSGLSDVTLTVSERIPGETRYGAFFEETYGFGVSSFTRHRNLLGTFNEGSISTLIAQHRQELVLGYANPLLFGTAIPLIPTAIRFDDHLFLDHEKIAAPTNPDSLVERYEVENRGDLTFGLTDQIRARNTYDASYVRKQRENLFTLKAEIGLDFDYTDNSYDPTLGFRVAPTLGVGGKVERSTGDGISPGLTVGNIYTYSDITTSLYLPVWGPLYSAFAASYGRVFDEATEDDAQVFYQGGGRSVRGYRFRSLFPYKVQEASEPGEESQILAGLSPRYLRLNQELRLNLPWKPLRNFQAVQFTDWAHVSDTDTDFEPMERMAWGLGLRYKWQFLTVRLDYTLQKEFQSLTPESGSFSRLSFDLSQAI